MPLPCSLKGDMSLVLTLALFLFPLRKAFSNFLVFLGLGASWDVGLSVSGTNGFSRMWAPVRTPVNWGSWSPCRVPICLCYHVCAWWAGCGAFGRCEPCVVLWLACPSEGVRGHWFLLLVGGLLPHVPVSCLSTRSLTAGGCLAEHCVAWVTWVCAWVRCCLEPKALPGRSSMHPQPGSHTHAVEAGMRVSRGTSNHDPMLFALAWHPVSSIPELIFQRSCPGAL